MLSGVCYLMRSRQGILLSFDTRSTNVSRYRAVPVTDPGQRPDCRPNSSFIARGVDQTTIHGLQGDGDAVGARMWTWLVKATVEHSRLSSAAFGERPSWMFGSARVEGAG